MATHHFLDAAYFNYIEERLAADYFPAVTLEAFMAGDDQKPNCAAFMGYNVLSDTLRLEMLFVAPSFHRQGVGTSMLERAKALAPRILVDVNEQNIGAVGFYITRGFRVIGRSALDSCHKPYPLLHLQYEQDEAP